MLVYAAQQQLAGGLRAARARARERRADGIALVRHRRGSSPGRLAHLGDLRLCEQRDVDGDLGGRTGRNRERGGDPRDGDAVRVPREHRRVESELRRIRVEHVEPTVAERGEGARRAAELGG